MRFSSTHVLAASLSVAYAGIFPRNFFTPGGSDDPAKVEEAHKEAEAGAAVTETVYNTVTVNGEGAHQEFNVTSPQTVTVEAPAAHCPEPVIMDPHDPNYDPKKFEG